MYKGVKMQVDKDSWGGGVPISDSKCMHVCFEAPHRDRWQQLVFRHRCGMIWYLDVSPTAWRSQKPLVSYQSQPLLEGFWGVLNFETLMNPCFLLFTWTPFRSESRREKESACLLAHSSRYVHSGRPIAKWKQIQRVPTYSSWGLPAAFANSMTLSWIIRSFENSSMCWMLVFVVLWLWLIGFSTSESVGELHCWLFPVRTCRSEPSWLKGTPRILDATSLADAVQQGQTAAERCWQEAREAWINCQNAGIEALDFALAPIMKLWIRSVRSLLKIGTSSESLLYIYILSVSVCCYMFLLLDCMVYDREYVWLGFHIRSKHLSAEIHYICLMNLRIEISKHVIHKKGMHVQLFPVLNWG